MYALCRVSLKLTDNQKYFAINKGFLMVEIEAILFSSKEEINAFMDYCKDNFDRFKLNNDGQEIASGTCRPMHMCMSLTCSLGRESQRTSVCNHMLPFLELL